ncbi:MAG: helix-turn-helix transcriptional regulator [Euryarchaeota archaeon]|nr:helix-turn-helix transcriptional regulator [Euryarchaeota archaeon]
MNSSDEKDRTFISPVEATLSILEGKWKPLVIWKLKEKTLRFSQLESVLPNISPKMLTKQLRELEKGGLVGRKVYPEIPPRVEYFLTPKGNSLMPILDSLGAWGAVHLKDRIACPTFEKYTQVVKKGPSYSMRTDNE